MWLFSNKKHLSDEELVTQYYQTGNVALIGDLFEKHTKTIYGVCLYYFRDNDVAKDMVMQIFEKLMVELKKSEIKNFKGWLSFVVRNYCISELRKTNKYRFVSENYLDFEKTETTMEKEEIISNVDDEKLLSYLKECLPLLKENQQVCLKLFFIQNKSYQDIVEQTNFSLNEVKSYLQNGKRNLKLLIDEKIKNTKYAA